MEYIINKTILVKKCLILTVPSAKTRNKKLFYLLNLKETERG